MPSCRSFATVRATAAAVTVFAAVTALAAPPKVAAQTGSPCTKVASASGSDSAAGTEAQPFRTAQKLADSLAPGEVGCLRTGVYTQSVTVSRGGVPGAPVTLRAYPGEKATLVGRLWIRRGADHVTIEGLWLDGRNAGELPSPTVNANDVTFRHNDVTNHNTAICFVIGASDVDSSAAFGRATRTRIEANRIHHCGKLPATNHDHGIYVEGADDTLIRGNWIHDNADRGIQLYPDAQRTQIIGNVLDSNGTNVIFSGDGGVSSNGNVVRGNMITRARLRFNVESWYPAGTPKGQNNLVSANCLHGAARTDAGAAGISTSDGGFTATGNAAADPRYVDPAAGDYRLRPDSPCRSLHAVSPDALPGPGGTDIGASDEGAGEQGQAPAASGDQGDRPKPRSARVRPRVSLRVAATRARRGTRRHGTRRRGAHRRTLPLVGRVTGLSRPGTRRAVIQVKRRGKWRTVRRVRIKANGRFRAHLRPRRRAGRAIRVRAVVRGAARSRPLVVKRARR